MTWIDAWGFAKDAVFPLIAILWAFFKQKVDSLEDDIEENEDKCRELEKKLLFVESTYATKAEVTAMLNAINQTLMTSSNSLESRIEKIMDLKNTPIKIVLEELQKRMDK
ncbi:MAG: hypothetical protein [Cystoviridae sp.]|nr:MAG: hypothetical protein [Cystoviridae sp.]